MGACGDSSHQFHERHLPKSTAWSTMIRDRMADTLVGPDAAAMAAERPLPVVGPHRYA
jgi:hypothetical protein